jgi:SAM-dependent methyltransferase
VTYESVSEYAFPIDDDCYDIVLSGQVVEHVPRIWRWMREVSRVCKEGGVVITINPVSWQYHEAPLDCWRAYPEGMKALYEDSSLDVLLSRWESLETPGYTRYIPGRPRTHQPRPWRAVSRVLGHVRFPVERAVRHDHDREENSARLNRSESLFRRSLSDQGQRVQRSSPARARSVATMLRSRSPNRRGSRAG